MLFGKDLNRRVVRSAHRKATELSHSTSILSLFKIEFFVDVEGDRRFQVAHVRAQHMQEAITMCLVSTARVHGKNFLVHRKFDNGKDRSWLYNKTKYVCAIIDLRWYDFKIYMKNNA